MSDVFSLDQIDGQSGLDALVAQVKSAGERALRHFEAGVVPETKPDRSPVTVADKEVEAELRDYLERTFADAGFYGEESGKQDGSSPLRFVVDPIDGTRAFLRSMPTWSVLVGAEWHGEPVLGIAYMPALDELFVAAQGHGTTHNGAPIRVSGITKLADAMVCHGALQQFAEEDCEQVVAALGREVGACRGFADFDGYRQVLLGRADGMVDPGVKPYDICAPAVLIREAGGRLTSLQGANTIYDNGAIASNGHVHEALVALAR